MRDMDMVGVDLVLLDYIGFNERMRAKERTLGFDHRGRKENSTHALVLDEMGDEDALKTVVTLLDKIGTNLATHVRTIH